jgi:integrase
LTLNSRNKDQYNPINERVKYKYEQHLRRVGQKDGKTITTLLKHIRDFEVFLNFQGYEKFNDHTADKYIHNMFNVQRSLSYITNNIRALKDFLYWLERQKGYRSKLNYNHIEYLNISRNQLKAAKATDYQKTYSYNQIIDTIRKMPNQTEKNKRDKAIISLQALCTLRISELRTVKIQNLIEENGHYFIYVSPKNMQVKFSKTRHAVFVPLPNDIVQNVLEWRDYVHSLSFKATDPLFPKINNRFSQANLLEQKIEKETIKSGTTIRNIFKKAFESAGFEYIRPHSFRNTLVRYAATQNPAFLNAVRQNLGHNSIDTTLNSYGQISTTEQGIILSNASIS